MIDREGDCTRTDFQTVNEYAWAIYLRLMCIRWEYRPQLFVLNSRPVCPAFWLPDIAWWVFVQDEPFPGNTKKREVRSVCDETGYAAALVSECHPGVRVGIGVKDGTMADDRFRDAFDMFTFNTPAAVQASFMACYAARVGSV